VLLIPILFRQRSDLF
jgi:hypothetical protein